MEERIAGKKDGWCVAKKGRGSEEKEESNEGMKSE